MRCFLSHSGVLLFGAGGTKGGVKRISLNKGCEGYSNWFLSERTRNVLAPLHHVLIPEYLIRLHEKRVSLERWQEANAADPSGQAVFSNVVDQSPFDYIEWNRRYRDELETAQRFTECVKKLEETLLLLERLTAASTPPSPSSSSGQQKKNGKMAARESAAESVEATEAEELLPLVEQDKEDLLTTLSSMEPEIEKIMGRRLDHEDIVGSSTRTWQLSVVGKAGGEEAGLFASELAEVLKAYCTNAHGWKVSVASSGLSEPSSGQQPQTETAAAAAAASGGGGSGGETSGGSGGMSMVVEGEGVYRYLHHEIGVHKVQRVPVTDAAGKMQTSTAVVKLTPILDPVSVQVYESDCKIDYVRGSGPGGQGMQSSSNCVVLTHLPSGISVKCHQSRSALGNKELALQMVSQQLLARRVKDQNASLHEAWQSQWSSGERSDKMRTYNFPQNRVTDHRLGRDYPLHQFLDPAAPTSLLFLLHQELNQISDIQELSRALLRHIQGNFGSKV